MNTAAAFADTVPAHWNTLDAAPGRGWDFANFRPLAPAGAPSN
jgi:hypothetical protein